MMMISNQIRGLYRDILRASHSLKDKNFREYFVRIARDDFRVVRNSAEEKDFIKQQIENLEVMKRQSIVQNMYYTENFTVKR